MPEFVEMVMTGTLGVTWVVIMDCSAYMSPTEALSEEVSIDPGTSDTQTIPFEDSCTV